MSSSNTKSSPPPKERVLYIRDVPRRWVSDALGSNILRCCPPSGPLALIDVLGLLVLDLFEVRFMAGIPKTSKPLRIDDLALLQHHAVTLICRSAPDITAEIVTDAPVAGTTADDVVAVAWPAYRQWTRDTLVPLARFGTPRHPGLPETERETMLWSAWRQIRRESFLALDLERCVRSLGRALHLPTRFLRAAAAHGSTAPNECVRFVNGLFPGSLEHLYFDKAGTIAISERKVRRRLDKSDHPFRTSTRKTRTAHGEISEKTQARTPDSSTDVDAVEEIVALRELAELADATPEAALCREIVGFVLDGDIDAVRRTTERLSHLLRAARATSTAAVKAEVAYILFSGNYSREDVARRFGCTVDAMRYACRIASDLVARESA